MTGVESRAELMITSRVLTMAQIASRTGLETDEARKKGERREVTHGDPVREGESRWVLRSNLSQDKPLTTHVADLIGKLTPHVDEIRALAGEHSVTFVCVIYAESEIGYNQKVFLRSEQVDLISAMGASMWFDVYLLGGD